MRVAQVWCHASHMNASPPTAGRTCSVVSWFLVHASLSLSIMLLLMLLGLDKVSSQPAQERLDQVCDASSCPRDLLAEFLRAFERGFLLSSTQG